MITGFMFIKQLGTRGTLQKMCWCKVKESLQGTDMSPTFTNHVVWIYSGGYIDGENGQSGHWSINLINFGGRQDFWYSAILSKYIWTRVSCRRNLNCSDSFSLACGIYVKHEAHTHTEPCYFVTTQTLKSTVVFQLEHQWMTMSWCI